jgi:diguanylate cyclase (GGDEF)-like protein
MGGLLSALESAALHDPLTSLPNRRLLVDRISQAFNRAERTKSPVAVLFIDLGGFKGINDRFGHEAGDQALIEIGQRIKDAVRRADTVARLGGDEFVVVCEGLTHAQAETLAHRVRADVASPLEIKGTLVELTVDLGVAVEMAPEQGDVGALLDAADRAMYRAKAAAKRSPSSR